MGNSAQKRAKTNKAIEAAIRRQHFHKTYHLAQVFLLGSLSLQNTADTAKVTSPSLPQVQMRKLEVPC